MQNMWSVISSFVNGLKCVLFCVLWFALDQNSNDLPWKWECVYYFKASVSCVPNIYGKLLKLFMINCWSVFYNRMQLRIQVLWLGATFVVMPLFVQWLEIRWQVSVVYLNHIASHYYTSLFLWYMINNCCYCAVVVSVE